MEIKTQNVLENDSSSEKTEDINVSNGDYISGFKECDISYSLVKPKRTFYTVVIKRILDVVLSGIAILILSPLLLLIAILELFFHGRPVFFAQERPGLNEKIFKLYKFRSMTEEKDAHGELLPGEQRVTKFGHFLRRFSLDELPELFSILKGDMSIIGPRPLLVKYLPLYNERHKHRHDVRPGLTCVSLKAITTWTWNDQFENDIWYIENCSLLVDIRMIFAVLREAIVGSEYRVDDTRPEYDGTNLHYDPKKN